MFIDIVKSYSNFFGQLNKETRYHCLSVGEICESCAPNLGIDKELAFKIGVLHDIGKIYVPSRILKKNKSLTSLEREVVDLHSYFGYHLLKIIGEESSIYLPILFHHGFKKPRLSEPDEPVTELNIRCTSLVHSVDIFDAMSRKRIYHDPFRYREIYDVLKADPMCTPEILNELQRIEIVSVQEIVQKAESIILNHERSVL